MTRAEVLADLDQRFDDLIADEVAQLRAMGSGEALIQAFIEENRRRFAEMREQAADSVFAGDEAHGHTRH